MRRVLGIVVAALGLTALALTATAAQSQEAYAAVDNNQTVVSVATVKVTFRVSDNGTATVGEDNPVPVTTGSEIIVFSGDTITVKASPADGYYPIFKVQGDGYGFATVNGNTYVVGDITEDILVIVNFARGGIVPTADPMGLTLTGLSVLALAALAFVVVSRRKEVK